MYSLETERLGLRPFRWDDLDFLAALQADPDVARYISYGIPRTREQSRQVLEGIIQAYSEDSVGQLAVYMRDSDLLIGRCGLTLIEIEAAPAPGQLPQWYWNRASAPDGMAIVHKLELGYTFAKQYWGSGFATESAKAVCHHAFSNSDNECLVSAISPGNLASKNVARKVGFSHIGEITAFGTLTEHYEIGRLDWTRQAAE